MSKPAPGVLKGVQLRFCNFEGREDRLNNAGSRNFNVVLDPEMAAQMAKDGWNVKEKPPREEYDETEPRFLLKVNVSYKLRAPRIFLITYPDGPEGEPHITPMTESMISMLDWADIEYADMVITSSTYQDTRTGEEGISAYLQSLYVVIREDELEQKWGVNRLMSSASPDVIPPELS